MSINSWIRLIRLDNIIFEKIKPRTYFRVNGKRAKITNHLNIYLTKTTKVINKDTVLMVLRIRRIQELIDI
jgi:hypothetical protein